MLIVALWCAGTGFLACVTRVLSQARLALRSAATLVASHRGSEGLARPAQAKDACVSLTLTWP